jgi:hypothetical protein
MTSTPISLEQMLSAAGLSTGQQRELFALVALGVLESLENKLLTPVEALRVFFTFDNCRFVQMRLQSEPADAVMSHGVQLADLFEVLPDTDASRELVTEISAMRQRCLHLLETERLVA